MPVCRCRTTPERRPRAASRPSWAYGLDTLRGRALLTPYARAALAPGGEQAWHLGTRLELAQAFDLSLEASRRDGPADPEHALTLRANLPW